MHAHMCAFIYASVLLHAQVCVFICMCVWIPYFLKKGPMLKLKLINLAGLADQ